MKKTTYIVSLFASLMSAACSNEEFRTMGQTETPIEFTATLQTIAPVNARAIGDNKGETETLPYIYDIRIRKVDQNGTIETEIFNVRPANKGTLDMDAREENGVTKTAFTWTDKTNATDFYAWTVPTGVTMENNKTEGTVNFGLAEGEGNNPKTESRCNKFNEDQVTPLEVFVSAYRSAKYTDDPSVSLPFKHLVSKINIQVYKWDNEQITDSITITFPYINKVWKIRQEQSGNKASLAVTAPDTKSDELSLTLKDLYLYQIKDQTSRIFYLPPMDDNTYNFKENGDFEISYAGETYYGSLQQSGQTGLKAGEYMILRIDLNRNYGTGVGAWIKDWDHNKVDNAYANPYRGIYTTEGLKVLKDYLSSNDVDKTLPDSLYIEESGKKIIRLYNDLTLADEDWSLKLENDMIFDGLGHIVTIPTGKSLFGDLTATAGQPIAINNIRLAGAGQLAASTGAGVTLYNCHANGTGHLIGTAKDGTTFDFCSAETATTLLAGTTSGTITVQNCFVAYNGATAFAGTGGTFTVKNSFIFNTVPASTKGTYYDYNGSSTTDNISVDASTGKLVVTTNAGTTPPTTKKLIDLLNDPTSTGTSSNQWVYVYGKDYPVMRIK